VGGWAGGWLAGGTRAHGATGLFTRAGVAACPHRHQAEQQPIVGVPFAVCTHHPTQPTNPTPPSHPSTHAPADATVCPVAIKYNKIFVDAFWNSKRQSFSAHLVSGEGRLWRCCLQFTCGQSFTAPDLLSRKAGDRVARRLQMCVWLALLGAPPAGFVLLVVSQAAVPSTAVVPALTPALPHPFHQQLTCDLRPTHPVLPRR